MFAAVDVVPPVTDALLLVEDGAVGAEETVARGEVTAGTHVPDLGNKGLGFSPLSGYMV